VLLAVHDEISAAADSAEILITALLEEENVQEDAKDA
jgi:hypothetical protein